MRAGYERNESGEDRREIEFGTKFEFRLETFQSKIRRVHRWVYLRHLSLTLRRTREEGRKRKRGWEWIRAILLGLLKGASKMHFDREARSRARNAFSDLISRLSRRDFQCWRGEARHESRRHTGVG